jgi:hypothetical protein
VRVEVSVYRLYEIWQQDHVHAHIAIGGAQAYEVALHFTLKPFFTRLVEVARRLTSGQKEDGYNN